jgi:predicted lactoylglutathione lyase
MSGWLGNFCTNTGLYLQVMLTSDLKKSKRFYESIGAFFARMHSSLTVFPLEKGRAIRTVLGFSNGSE